MDERVVCLAFAESPLTFAAHLDNMVEIIKVLKNGGAHLDFRARDGLTALHKAARSRNLASLTVSLQPPLSHPRSPQWFTCSILRRCWSWELRQTTKTVAL